MSYKFDGVAYDTARSYHHRHSAGLAGGQNSRRFVRETFAEETDVVDEVIEVWKDHAPGFDPQSYVQVTRDGAASQTGNCQSGRTGRSKNPAIA
jgi:hypothetical protein